MPDIEFGEFAPDQPLYKLGPSLQAVINMLPSDRGLVPATTGVVQPDAVLDDNCRGAYSIQYYDRTTRLFAGDTAKLYSVLTSGATDISKAGGYDLAGSTSPLWDFTSAGETVLAATLSEKVQQFAKGDTLFSDLTEAPQARHVATLGLQESFTVLGDIIDGASFPNRVQWNNPGDLTAWTSGVDLAGQQDLEGDGGPITNILSGEFGVVFQERAVWAFEFSGPPEIYLFRKILVDHGSVSSQGSALHNNSVYYLNRTGFYKIPLGGTGIPEPIGAGRVDEFFWDRVDLTRLDEIQAVSDSTEDLILWAYPTANTDDFVKAEFLAYSPIADKWGFVAEQTEFTGFEFLFTGFSESVTIDEISTPIDADPIANTPIDSIEFAGTRRFPMAFNHEHKLTYFTGGPRRALLTTGLLQPNPEGFALINKMRPLIERAGGAVRATLIVHEDLTSSGLLLPIRPLSQFGYFEFRTVRPFPRGRYFQIVLEIDGGWFGLNGMSIVSRNIPAVGGR